MKPTIYFCGYGNRDLIVRLPSLPTAGERVHAQSIQPFDGGMAANAAVAAARFGAQTHFVGAVGMDAVSAEFLAVLHSEGISTDHTSRKGFLSYAVILVDGMGERAVVSQNDSLDTGKLAEFLSQIEPGAGQWVYFDGYRWDRDWAFDPSGLNIVVDVDGSVEKEHIVRAARVSRHLLGSQKTFIDTCGFSQSELGDLTKKFGTTIVVTRGKDGITLLEPGCEPWNAPAFPVQVVDDTGAGDCFAGVYIASLAAGDSSREAALAASGAASLSCLSSGARAAPHAEEISALLATTTNSPNHQA